MKRLDVFWEGVHDSTGYMFSFAKGLSCAVKNSPRAEFVEDIVATSGFAFRMWAVIGDTKTLKKKSAFKLLQTSENP